VDNDGTEALMSVDIEPAGDLATAALIAKEIEGDAGKTQVAVPAAAASCANCKTPLTGAYCYHCGQPAHVHRSLFHMLEEVVHGLLHFDTKSWRTLPLLFGRPGLLTRRYIEGQRVRYVSPLALFLFSVFLMYFVFSMLDTPGIDGPAKATANVEEARTELTKQVEEGRQLVAKRTQELSQATTPEDKEAATEELTEAQEELKGLEVALEAVNAVPDVDASGQPPSRAKVSSTATNAALDKLNVKSSSPRIEAAVRHAVENPELTLYKLKTSAYKFAFLLVPISLPFLWLMFFWRKGVKLYDHAIFSLYSLSFMSMWFVLIALTNSNRFTQGFVAAMLMVPPVHIFVHLKETYSLGWFSTWWRTIALLIAAGFIVLLFTLLILVITLQ
jgi:Protein of unknown function (DUF3667)